MGGLELLIGPMYSSKTEYLQDCIHRQRFRYEHSDERPTVLSFKPVIDTRYGEQSTIVSHNDSSIPCLLVSSSADIRNSLEDERHAHVRVIGVDEIQFLDDGIIQLCLDLIRKRNIHVIASGLSLDFRGEPFRFRDPTCFARDSEHHMGELMVHAYPIDLLTAFCAYKLQGNKGPRCGQEARCTQRLFKNGDPVPYDDPLIIPGGKEVLNERYYEARCKDHHVVPGRPW